jgi:hypothetical protein
MSLLSGILYYQVKFCTPLRSPYVCATCLDHLILLDLITVILGAEYKLRN